MGFVETWKSGQMVAPFELWEMTRSVLVETAIALLKQTGYQGFHEQDLRHDVLEKYQATGTRPRDTIRQKDLTCALGTLQQYCWDVSWKGYNGQIDPTQAHDHFRLYPVTAKHVINHDWELSARVDWVDESLTGGRIGRVLVGLAGTTPQETGSLGRAQKVRDVLKQVPLVSPDQVLPSAATYLNDPAEGRLGDTTTLAIGWNFAADDFSADADLVLEMGHAACWAWCALQDAVNLWEHQ